MGKSGGDFSGVNAGRGAIARGFVCTIVKREDFRRALQTGVRLFADDAESKEYLARLAVHAKDWAVAEQAVADSLVADKIACVCILSAPIYFP